MANLIIAGIGGQGINRLARVIAECCRDAGLQCQYSVHKGGAQTLGCVYAEIRTNTLKHTTLGPGIPAGSLDGLVALDPWEALRHLPLAHRTTPVWVESETQPLFRDRTATGQLPTEALSPVDQLNSLPIPIHWKGYRKLALKRTGDVRMANYFAGLDSLSALNLSDRPRYHEIFYQQIAGAAALLPETA
jgi:Pyruvate/2-oxoacid:ferredoxin oxidoreductase gamma subunit